MLNSIKTKESKNEFPYIDKNESSLKQILLVKHNNDNTFKLKKDENVEPMSVTSSLIKKKNSKKGSTKNSKKGSTKNSKKGSTKNSKKGSTKNSKKGSKKYKGKGEIIVFTQ
jgi:hypothetical protein